jgi:probable rRNA maturation factor
VTIEAAATVRRRVPPTMRRRLADRLRRAMVAAGEGASEVSVRLVDDREIRALNREWRGKDQPTDVLSFAMREGEGGWLHPELLGDIAISIDTATRQADEEGRTLEEELLHLAVHGLVHLVGYDHATVDEERRMFGWEALLRAEATSKRAVRSVPRP